MAPRSRARAAEAKTASDAAPSIADLPDEALGHCLGFLEFKERCVACWEASYVRRTASCSALGARSACQPLPPTAAAAAAAHRLCRPCRQQLALVSKRFAAAVCSPELLREVDVRPRLTGMASFVRWLMRHRQHIWQLKCAPSRKVLGGERGPITEALDSCLPALGAAGQLQELELTDWWGGMEWLASMRSLRRLVFHSRRQQPVSPAALTGLTRLEELLLLTAARFEPELRLPPSITWLELMRGRAAMPQQVCDCPAWHVCSACCQCRSLRCRSTPQSYGVCFASFLLRNAMLQLPHAPQVTQLPNLQRLAFVECRYTADSMGSLSALSGSLTRLQVEESVVSPSLGTLTGLHHLQLEEYRSDSLHAVNGALQALTQLTCLVSGLAWLSEDHLQCGQRASTPAAVRVQTTAAHGCVQRPHPLAVFLSARTQVLREHDLCSLPPAVGSLPRLQRLCIDDMGTTEMPLMPPLPAGPMLQQLRWLAAGMGTLVKSAAVLQAAEALEYVAMLEGGMYIIDWQSAAVAAFFDWLACHPPLRCLSIDADLFEAEGFDWPGFVLRLLPLLRRRPLLSVRCPGIGDEGPTFSSLLESEATSPL